MFNQGWLAAQVVGASACCIERQNPPRGLPGFLHVCPQYFRERDCQNGARGALWLWAWELFREHSRPDSSEVVGSHCCLRFYKVDLEWVLRRVDGPSGNHPRLRVPTSRLFMSWVSLSLHGSGATHLLHQPVILLGLITALAPGTLPTPCQVLASKGILYFGRACCCISPFQQEGSQEPGVLAMIEVGHKVLYLHMVHYGLSFYKDHRRARCGEKQQRQDDTLARGRRHKSGGAGGHGSIWNWSEASALHRSDCLRMLPTQGRYRIDYDGPLVDSKAEGPRVAVGLCAPEDPTISQNHMYIRCI